MQFRAATSTVWYIHVHTAEHGRDFSVAKSNYTEKLTCQYYSSSLTLGLGLELRVDTGKGG